MILDKPSKWREVSNKKDKEVAAILKLATPKTEELIAEIGLAGLLGLLAKLCRQECPESKTGDSTLNFIALRLDILGVEIAGFRETYKIIKKESNHQGI